MTTVQQPHVTFKGKPVTLEGQPVQVGRQAPQFTVLDNDLNEVRLSQIKGPLLVISSVPSLDTPVCDRETRRFNEEASRLGGGVKVLTISMDLPFAQKRWCGAAGIQHVQTLSDHRDASFGRAFGTLIKELRLLSRAVFIIDGEGTVQYAQWVGEITSEPDYQAVLDAVSRLRER